jgi:hypothetical protein
MMNVELLQAIGLTQEEIQRRVIDRIVAELMEEEAGHYDEDTGQSYKETRASQLERELRKTVQTRIAEQVIAVADAHLTPRIREIIESTKLQATNKWGEKQSEPMSFCEYLVKRAEAYMTEEVNLQGKTRGERDHDFKGVQTRIAYMVHCDLYNAVHKAVQEALTSANTMFAKSLQDMVNAKLAEVAGAIKLSMQYGK